MEGEVGVANYKDTDGEQGQEEVDALLPRPFVSEKVDPATELVLRELAIDAELEVCDQSDCGQDDGHDPDGVPKDEGFDRGSDHPPHPLPLVEEHPAEVDRPALVH